MNSRVEIETIRFSRETDLQYSLVYEGTREGSSKLGYLVQLVEREMGLELKRAGYFGQGTYSRQTFYSNQAINPHTFAAKMRRLLRLPLLELAAIIRQQLLLGPKIGEPAYSELSEQTGVAILKTWCLEYYQSNGIDCPDCLADLERYQQYRWRRIATNLLWHNLETSFLTPLKVAVYRQLLEAEVALPPLICLRRRWELLEGYHRLGAHREAGNVEVNCIVIGRA